MTDATPKLTDVTPSDVTPADATSNDAGSTVLLGGFDPESAEELGSRLAPDAAVVTVATAEELDRRLDDEGVAVVCLGPELSGEAAEAVLRSAVGRPGAAGRCHVVLAAGPELERFQDFVDADQVYYLSQKMPPLADAANVLRSALAHQRTRHRRAGVVAGREVEMERVLAAAQSLAGQQDLERAVPLAAHAVIGIADADRAECLLYDPDTETLWSPRPEREEERRESAAAGVVSYVLRTGMPVALERVGDDPRYDPEADNDGGPVDERFLAVPVKATDGRTLAVLTARRDGSRSPFSERQEERLKLLAEQVAPALGRLVLRRQLEDRGRYEGVGEEATRLFRREALDHHTRGFGDQGDLLHISPAWTPWAFRVVVLVFVAAVAYSLLGSIHEYASGPAVVRVEGRSDVTAAVAGTVMAIEVGPEERVEAGQLLVRFYGAQEAAELERIRREFELGLINRLRNPADPSTERALGALQAQKRLAEARLEERSVRAPQAGIVSDLRVRAGQHLVPGEVILSLRGENPRLAILALLPGQYRPLLRPGMTLRFEPRGYRYAYQHLTIDRIDDEVVGPNEARRFLGAGIGDAVPLSGPVVFVHARLPDRTFESGGRSYEYHEGTLGTAEARVRSERILTALLPGLEGVFGGSGG